MKPITIDQRVEAKMDALRASRRRFRPNITSGDELRSETGGHLRNGPSPVAGRPSSVVLSPETEKSIAWFCETILTLSARNQRLCKELIFYRTVCRVLAGTIALALVAAVVIYLLGS